jgi:hypothetical protein
MGKREIDSVLGRASDVLWELRGLLEDASISTGGRDKAAYQSAHDRAMEALRIVEGMQRKLLKGFRKVPYPGFPEPPY